MKTYIVTDPCYIIRNAWGRMGENGKWNENVVEYLEGLTKTNAWSFDTGYGDWRNTMDGDGVHDDHYEFTADAGMVCVCEYTADVEYTIHCNSIPDHCYALVDMDGEVEVTADTSAPHWTVIEITNGIDTAHSQYA